MGQNIKFTAFFVKDIQDLLKRFPPKHKKIFGRHSTIEFQPNNLDDIEVGKEYAIKVLGRAWDEFGDDLLVENLKSKNKYPHITLSPRKFYEKPLGTLLEPPLGFEPRTFALQKRCSTN